MTVQKSSGTSTTSTTTTASPSEKPDAFLKRLIDYDFKGQWGRSWALLHPGQRHYVGRKFTDCMNAAAPDAELVSTKTIEIYERPDPRSLRFPQRRSKAVAIRGSQGALRQRARLKQLSRYTPLTVKDRWAWILGSADIAAYKSGSCPP